MEKWKKHKWSEDFLFECETLMLKSPHAFWLICCCASAWLSLTAAFISCTSIIVGKFLLKTKNCVFWFPVKDTKNEIGFDLVCQVAIARMLSTAFTMVSSGAPDLANSTIFLARSSSPGNDAIQNIALIHNAIQNEHKLFHFNLLNLLWKRMEKGVCVCVCVIESQCSHLVKVGI